MMFFNCCQARCQQERSHAECAPYCASRTLMWKAVDGGAHCTEHQKESPHEKERFHGARPRLPPSNQYNDLTGQGD
jgi:hypothetical protein